MSHLLRVLQAGPSRPCCVQTVARQTNLQRRTITFVPRKQKHRVSKKPRNIKWHSGGSSRGSTVLNGSYALRTKQPTVLKQATFAAVHAALQRYTKGARDVKIIWRQFPHTGVSQKGAEIKMGKGRGTFAYLAAKVKANKVLVELQCPNLTETQMRRALKSASARLPCPTDVIDRDTLPRVGLGSVPRDWKAPQSMHGGSPALGVIDQKGRSTEELLKELKFLGTPAAAGIATEKVLVTTGPKRGRMRERTILTAPPATWRQRMLALYDKKIRRKHQAAALVTRRATLAAQRPPSASAPPAKQQLIPSA